MSRRKLRRAGAMWRILVHSMEPGGMSGDSWDVASDSRFGGGDGQDTSVEHEGRTYHQRHVELPNTDFDELVISRWLHLEQMDTGVYWLNVGGVTVLVKANRDGKPLSVDVYGPEDYAEPVDGCKYTCTWTDPEPECAP